MIVGIRISKIHSGDVYLGRVGIITISIHLFTTAPKIKNNNKTPIGLIIKHCAEWYNKMEIECYMSGGMWLGLGVV